jgi:thioredoxin 1
MKNIKRITGAISGLLTVILLISCINPAENRNSPLNKPASAVTQTTESQKSVTDTTIPGKVYKVTFIELGSVRCIPCKKMQPVMKSIEEKYGDQVKVVFHDVWTPEGEPFGDNFGIKSIPTQVFLDAKGKEFFRHEGFFPEEELVKILKEKGIR